MTKISKMKFTAQWNWY